jgi:hypothetical protein
MAFIGANVQIPVFMPVDPAAITQAEWDNFEDEATMAFRALHFANHMMDPNYIQPALNPAFAV